MGSALCPLLSMVSESYRLFKVFACCKGHIAK
jgi:hypothetical protein